MIPMDQVARGEAPSAASANLPSSRQSRCCCDHSREYTLRHFMGYRFALFNFATKTAGGFVEFDYFCISGQITGSN
jgi:hypothetical protein